MAVPDDFRTARFVSASFSYRALSINSVVIFQSQMRNELFSAQVTQGVL